MKDYICSLKEADDVSRFGGKAANLAKMLQAGLPVPDGFAVSIDAFDAKGKLKTESAIELKKKLDHSKPYAVRSSALAEDAEGASWAGQFETFLNTKLADVVNKIEECHNSTKERAKAYAEGNKKFDIAVVVQEMLEPEYAGVAFTKDPSDGSNKILIEYVKGLGEALVHGDVDPGRIIWSRSKRVIKSQTEKQLPFPLRDLVSLTEKVERQFGGIPQDIEWVYTGGQLWLVQSRPITTLQERGEGKHYLGDPGKLFYWGPSRAQPLYMSDFTAAAAAFFARTIKQPDLPDAPKTLVLFHDNQVVWLIKQAAFNKFVTDLFRIYEKDQRLNNDRRDWHQAVEALDDYLADSKTLDLKKVNQLFNTAWSATIEAEFSLYGAETVLHDRLSRFDDKDRQIIWGGMTLPNQPTFMQRVDIELVKAGKPAQLADKYPWIEDGYSGVFDNALPYFQKRLKIVQNNTVLQAGSSQKRAEIIKQYDLKPSEIKALDLARELSVFMDERKAWMMRSRSYIKLAAKLVTARLGVATEQINRSTLDRLADGKTDPYQGGSFMDGKHIMLNLEDANLAWDWYVEFRAAHSVLQGLVASSGGRHFINGEVFVAHSPQDGMPDNAVLVVPSTSPSYVPLMRKARALITDHGGMMSHAAIVAREFGLPCIVGTKQATKILKNGDKVVLDLVKGEVNQ